MELNQMTYHRRLGGIGDGNATLRLLIPGDIKLALHWQEGDTVELSCVNDVVMIRKLEVKKVEGNG
jgi:hypothetical protein